MKIKINNKDHEIKPASELTVAEYIELFDPKKDNSNCLGMLINYISIVTKIGYNNVADIDIDRSTIRRLLSYVGEIHEAHEMPILDEFYHKRTGKRFYQKSLNWRTLGARKMLEEKKLDNPLEQAVYLLSCYVSGNYDSSKVETIYKELQNYNALKVYGFVIFFFQKLVNGQKLGKSYWLMRKVRAFINILRSLRK